MSSGKIRTIIKKTLKGCSAGNVTITRLQGIKEDGKSTTVDTLFLSMGDCTGEEFEGIKLMRQTVSMFHGINITNVVIDL